MKTLIITGTLGRDAETRTIGERSYLRITVAADGRKKDDPTWVDVMHYVREGSQLGTYLKKGAVISASGELAVKGYAKRDGSVGAEVTLWADNLEIVKFAPVESAPAPQPAPASQAPTDLPF